MRHIKSIVIKKLLICLYIATIAVLAVSTIVAHVRGADLARQYIYGSWWFCALWGILTLTGITWIIIRKMRRPNLILLHSALIIILIGALLTHLTSYQGVIHLRKGEKTSIYATQTTSEYGLRARSLPFYITLNRFTIKYDSTINAPKDYVSDFTIEDGYHTENAEVSMNNIYSYKNIRLYQNSYNTDDGSCYMSINHDPYGITVTYIGYLILFAALIWLLINSRGAFRQQLHEVPWHAAQVAIATFITAICLAIIVMTSEITPVQPVLRSPLFSVHVSIIIIAYALFAVTFICGIAAIIRKLAYHKDTPQLQLLSRLCLYPALTTLTIGIFVGAIWANISWGTYWNWDPKEVWALITLMIYAVAAHTDTFQILRRPLPYHVFMALAFLSVIITFFGVSYVLGGMHSYVNP